MFGYPYNDFEISKVRAIGVKYQHDVYIAIIQFKYMSIKLNKTV